MAAENPHLDLALLIRDLGVRLGNPKPDVSDEHVRWDLYVRALDAGGFAEVVQNAVRAEVDNALAQSVVFRAFEQEPQSSWIAWVESLADARNRDAALRRLVDHVILAALTDPVGAEVVQRWSDWLQRRLALGASSAEVLTALAQWGRTKRVRHDATESMRKQHPR